MNDEMIVPYTPEELAELNESEKEIVRNKYLMHVRTLNEIKAKREEKRSDGNLKRSHANTDRTIKMTESIINSTMEEYKMLGGTEEEMAEFMKNQDVTPHFNRLQKDAESFMKKYDAQDELEKYTQTDKNEIGYYPKNENNKKNATTEEIQELHRRQKAQASSELEKYLNEDTMEEPKQEIVPRVENAIENEPLIPMPTNQTENIADTNNIGNMEPNINPKEMCGVVKLPSKGECYKNKMKEVRVSYLTAYDENMFYSPNLYADGNLFEYLVKAKILDKVNVDELLPCDIEAIIIWLRGSGYGVDYPISVFDEQSGKDIETTVDLSKIEYLPFNLIGDENGYFDYETSTHDKIKFRFLNQKDTKFLEKLRIKESNKLRINQLKIYLEEINDCIKGNKDIEDSTAKQIETLTEKIKQDVFQKYNPDKDLTFSHELTDRILLHTVSVNGITDRSYINNYILNLSPKEVAAYRNYILKNMPGIEHNMKVERPLSLGGGSIDLFLRFGQDIFLNVGE